MPKESQNKENHNFSGLQEWMESSQGRKLMDRLAHSVRDTVVSRNLPLSFINNDPFGSRTDSDLFQEIRSELVLFLLENADQLKRHLMCGDRNFPALVKQRFIAQWLTGARTPARDPFRYLYKRTQDLLKEVQAPNMLWIMSPPGCSFFCGTFPGFPRMISTRRLLRCFLIPCLPF